MKLCLVLLGALICQACGSSSSEPACKSDVDCPGAFCDRGSCAQIAADGRENYGIACDPPPISPETGRPDLRSNRCGAFLCLEHRCRSCATDDECRATLGAPTCGTVPGWPGRSCGDYAGEASNPGGAAPPDPRPLPPMTRQ